MQNKLLPEDYDGIYEHVIGEIRDDGRVGQDMWLHSWAMGIY